MAGTQIRSTRNAISIEGSNQFELVSTCIEAGTLSDTNIFLVSIVQPNDPKSDTLLRVIALADVTNFKTDRDEAIAAGDTSWRSPEVRLLYTDIETANAGQKELASRINTLVEDFDINNDEFEVVNEIVIYPIADPSVKTQLQTDFGTARDAATAAQTARDAKVATCVVLEAEATVLQERLTEAEADFAATAAYSGQYVSLHATAVNIQTNTSTRNSSATSLTNSSDATAGQKTSIQTEHSAITDEMRVLFDSNLLFNTTNATVASQVSALQTRVNTHTTSLAAKNLELSTCTKESVQLQGTLDAARATEDAALAAVTAVCPDFDINSV